jgi:hypothetical protein
MVELFEKTPLICLISILFVNNSYVIYYSKIKHGDVDIKWILFFVYFSWPTLFTYMYKTST